MVRNLEAFLDAEFRDSFGDDACMSCSEDGIYTVQN